MENRLWKHLYVLLVQTIFLSYGLTCLTSVEKFNDYDLFYLIVDEFGRKKCLSLCIKKKLL